MRARELFETPYPEWYAAGTVVDITSDRYDVAEYLEGDEFDYEYRLCMVPASLIADPDFAPIPTHSETGEERTASITTWANRDFTSALLENPPIVLWSGRFHNIDGYHRVNLAAQAGLATIPVIVGMGSPLTETSIGLFEHQISNPTEVRKYVATAVGQVTNADAAKWLHVALSRHINNHSEKRSFLVNFNKKKMSDEYLDGEVVRYVASLSRKLKTFISPAILADTDYELIDDYEVEESIGKLEQQTRDVVEWLNRGGSFSGMNFQDAAKKANTFVRQTALRAGLNDVTPVLDLGNGWRWVRIDTVEAARAEGYVMKNCLRHDIKKFHTGNLRSYPLYSLRDRKNMPHVNYGGDGEPFGIANSDVKPQYLPAIAALEKHLTGSKSSLSEAVGAFPTRSFRKLWHVGSMKAEDKRQGSYEGAGLSVSLHPDEWRQIARGMVSGDTWEMTKADNRFLDYWKIGKRRWGSIRQWAIENGWAEPCTQYQVSWWDEELEDTVSFVFDTREEAVAESDPEYNEDVEIEEIPTGLTGTAKLATRCHQRGSSSSPQDLLAVVYAEDVLGLDGVWWSDVLDPQRLSAPRGVIVPTKVSSWGSKKVA